MAFNNKVGDTIKRELIRALLERSQSIDKLQEMCDNTLDTPDEEVEETLNVPYVNREEIALAMDIFKPVAPKDTEFPVIVTIHGGGLVIGDRKISRPFGRLLAKRGYLVFSLEYRLAPRANICQELDDVCAGMDYVGRMLVDYNVDFTRIFLVAESAGAYLATYIAAMKYSEKLQDAIGYKPSRLTFKALGLNCGMFYTNRKDPTGIMLSQQIYGDKRTDENFLQYMNPEHPEIINNLPPAYLSTCKGDFLNNYTFMMHEALKKAGKVSHLAYYKSDDIQHAFFTTDTANPLTAVAVDKMLVWLEAQADIERERNKKDPEVTKKRAQVKRRLTTGAINNQKVWEYIKERNSIERSQLEATAIIDGTREYTYEQMFTEWDRYAAVFSALGITGENGSRAAVCGAIAAEPLFCFYGLNMTGTTVSMFSYPDFLHGGMWKAMLEKEKITDLIITDMMVSPQLWYEIAGQKEKLGLRNVILLHTRLGGPCVGPAELVFNEFNSNALKQLPGTVFMDELLRKYASHPITYGKFEPDTLAIISHTSGTTKGTRKPLPFTDKALNIVCTGAKDGFKPAVKSSVPVKQLRRIVPFDFSSFLCMCGTTNSGLACGDAIVLTFFGFFHPKYIKAVEAYKVNVFFAAGFMMDKWMERTDLDDLDMSSVKIFAVGGSYSPPEKLKKYREFLKDHGYKNSLLRGYGMSETGAAELAVPSDCDDDVLGFPRPKENFRIQDENDGKFYTVDDGVRTGTMYVVSDSLCCNELDGVTLFEFTEIDGRNFICTNDMVRVNENGSFSYAGRADRFFVNNEGIRFEAGIVETKLAAHPNIDKCALVPVLDKRIHDTVPVLYAIPNDKKAGAEAVRKALYDVYITDGERERSILPSQFVLTDRIPCNSNGKIDIYRITRERLNGTAYNILPVSEDGMITDIGMEKVSHVDSIVAGTLPDNREENASFNLFDFFNAPPAKKASDYFPILQLGKKKKKKEKKEFPMPEMPAELTKLSNRAQGLLYGMKQYDYDFEDET